MGARKQYESRCPANCSGGVSNRLYRVTAEAVQLTPEALKRKQPGDGLYACSYCQFVWFQNSSSRVGFNPTPVGYYDNFRWPGEFHLVPESFSIRPENTSAYWYAYEEKLQSRRDRRR